MTEQRDENEYFETRPYKLDHAIVDRLRISSGREYLEFPNERFVEAALSWVILKIESVKNEKERSELQGEVFQRLYT